MEDRFFIGPSAIEYLDVGALKAVELLLQQDVPPPFYLSIDCVDDLLVVSAMPVYDYQKFLKCESFKKMIEAVKRDVKDLSDITDEEVADMGFWLLPAASAAAGFDIESGKTAIMNGNIESARIYASATKISDLDIFRLITKTGLN